MLYRLVALLERRLNRRKLTDEKNETPIQPVGLTAVVIGYGPVGRTLSRILRDNGIEPTIVEMNLETVQRIRAEGMGAVYGDAAYAETLQAAGIARASGLILSSSNFQDSTEIIRQARDLNPTIQVLARCSYLREAQTLRQAGADAAFAGEGEVALAMAQSILQQLGATGEQLDRERQRVREALFGK